MHPQRNLIEAAKAIYTTEAIEQPEPFRVKKTGNGGRDYNFENGGDVSISVNDDDHHVVNINHDNMSSVGAAIAHHISKTPGGPTSISTPDKKHRGAIRGALDASMYKYSVRPGGSRETWRNSIFHLSDPQHKGVDRVGAETDAREKLAKKINDRGFLTPDVDND